MTVAQLRETMPQDEFMRWTVFHGRKQQKQELEMLKAKARG